MLVIGDSKKRNFLHMIFASAFRFSVSGRRAGKLEIPSSKQGGSVRHGKKMIALRTLKRTGNITNNCFRKAIRLFIGKFQTFFLLC